MKSLPRTLGFSMVIFSMLLVVFFLPFQEAQANHTSICRNLINNNTATTAQLTAPDRGCTFVGSIPANPLPPQLGCPLGFGLAYPIPHDRELYFGSDAVYDPLGAGVTNPVACPVGAAGSTSTLPSMTQWFLWALAALLTLPATFAVIAIKLVSAGVAAVLTFSIVNHDFVQVGFPFVLNFVNFGFILAILFLAITTILGRDSGGFSKILARILIAALLVNFSLVIAGILLDLSRLLMAAMAAMVGNPNNLHNIGIDILRATAEFSEPPAVNPGGGGMLRINNPADGIPTVTLRYNITTLNDFVRVVVGVFTAVLFLVGLTVFGVVMFVRLIMLVLLLIFAPTPYVTALFPGTAQLARAWWDKFLKYIFLGPVLFFLLILLTRVPSVTINAPGGLISLNDIIRVALGAAVLGAGAMAGIKVSGYLGGATAAAWAGKVPGLVKKGGQFIARRPGTAIGLALGGPLGAIAGAGIGYGAKRLGKGAANTVGDYGRELDSDMRKSKTGWGTLYRSVAGTKRDKDGKPIKGQPSTLGQRAYDQLNPKSRAQISESRTLAEAVKAKGGMAAALSDPTLKVQINAFAGSGGFRNARAAAHFSPEDLARYAENSDNERGLKDLANNISKIAAEGKMGKGDLANIADGLSKNTTYKGRDVKVQRVVKGPGGAILRTEEDTSNTSAQDLARMVDTVQNAMKDS